MLPAEMLRAASRRIFLRMGVVWTLSAGPFKLRGAEDEGCPECGVETTAKVVQ